MPIPTKMLPEAVLNKLKRHRSVYQTARGVRMSFGSLMGARNIPGISGRVHFNDFMLDSTRSEDVEHYVKAGDETLTQIEGALTVAGQTWGGLRSVLEFGCGYGRITRALIQKVAPERLAVCDVIAEGPRFCAREFNVRAVPVTPEITDCNLAPSDLVVFISVHTHLSERRLEALQRRLIDLLTPGGICFFTTMGTWSANDAERYGLRWAGEKQSILKDLNQHGIAFRPYGYYSDRDYGMTWTTYGYTTSQLRRQHGDSLRLLRFEEGAQDGHQDFYVYQRV